jgi:hypothetical protein
VVPATSVLISALELAVFEVLDTTDETVPPELDAAWVRMFDASVTPLAWRVSLSVQLARWVAVPDPSMVPPPLAASHAILIPML